MKKTATGAAIAAAVGAAAMAAAYSMANPSAKRELRNDLRKTAHDMKDVKNEFCDVRQDMTEMARNFKNQM